VQNRAARIITGKSYEIRTSELLKELNWQTLEERRESGRFTFMFNVKNQEAPENMANLFGFSNNEKYDLRNNGINFQLDKPKTNFLKKSISYSGAKCWNNLPNEIKAKEMTMGQFKTFLRENDNIC
jgi:hypothetical protein